jgi:hypothetical protein
LTVDTYPVQKNSCWPCGGLKQMACPANGQENGPCNGSDTVPALTCPGLSPDGGGLTIHCLDGLEYDGGLPAPVGDPINSGWWFCLDE